MYILVYYIDVPLFLLFISLHPRSNATKRTKREAADAIIGTIIFLCFFFWHESEEQRSGFPATLK